MQWEEFLKLGDEVETSVVEEKIKSQRPEHCALLIYTVSYGNMLAMGHQIAIKKTKIKADCLSVSIYCTAFHQEEQMEERESHPTEW